MTEVTEPATTTRGDVRKAVTQAFRAGVPGIVISEYSEMKLDAVRHGFTRQTASVFS